MNLLSLINLWLDKFCQITTKGLQEFFSQNISDLNTAKVKVCTSKERSLIELMPIAPFVILEQAN
jgi:hypothetical protein